MAKKRVPMLPTRERLRKVDHSLKVRLRRARGSLIMALQGSIAAGLAFWAAREVVGHEQPFFAPMAAVILLGVTTAGRLQRGIELSIGATVGVAVGDLVIAQIGSGTWQLAVAVGLSLIIARLISPGVLVSNQVAIGSILIATIMPPGSAGGPDRAIDALIGCAVGLLVASVIPSLPLSAGRREIARVLALAASVLHDVADNLDTHNHRALREVLASVRGSQTAMNRLMDAVKNGREATTLSPLLWLTREKIRMLDNMLTPVDNALRNVRVLARRAVALCEDGGSLHPKLTAAIDELSDIFNTLAETYATPRRQDALETREAVRRLRALAGTLDLSLVEDGTLSEWVILAQARSIIVDLLQLNGMSRESALAVLPPTTSHPAVPPELFDADGNPVLRAPRKRAPRGGVPRGGAGHGSAERTSPPGP